MVVMFSTSGGTVTLASVNRRGPPISMLWVAVNGQPSFHRPGSALKIRG